MYAFNLMKGFSVFIFLLGLVSRADADPSFDCQKAASFTEKRICAVPALAEADAKLAKAYSQFLVALPEASRPTAKRMQQLWIRGRESWCGEKAPKALLDVSPSEFDTDSEIAIELYSVSPQDKDFCIRNYYQNAIDSLERGALVSRVFLVQGASNLRVGVGGVDALEIKTPERIKTESDYDTYLAQDIVILHGDKRLALTQAQLVGCESCVEGETMIPRELRFYLTRSGGLYNGLVQHFTYSGGRCGHDEQEHLSFFALDNTLIWYTQNDGVPDKTVNGINLYFISHACGTYVERYKDWSVDKNNLIFTKSKVASAYPFWVILGDMQRVVIKVDDRKIQNLPSVDKSTASLWGVPYATIYSAIRPLAEKDINAKNRCESVQQAIIDYMDIKAVGLSKNISNAQAMFILANVMNESYVRSMGAHYEVAVETFLEYLDKMRVVENWEQKLGEATGRYPEPNHHFFMSPEPDWQPGDNPFIQAGFYSDKGCMLDTAAPSFGVEEWIYRFWARRNARGEIDSVEAALRNFLKIRKSIGV